MDDDQTIRKMVARVLTEENYIVLQAANGQEALDLALATELDFVLLDLKLPGKSGWDTFERFTAEQPDLPVIIITARLNQLFTPLGTGVGALMEK